MVKESQRSGMRSRYFYRVWVWDRDNSIELEHLPSRIGVDTAEKEHRKGFKTCIASNMSPQTTFVLHPNSLWCKDRGERCVDRSSGLWALTSLDNSAVECSSSFSFSPLLFRSISSGYDFNTQPLVAAISVDTQFLNETGFPDARQVSRMESAQHYKFCSFD